MSTEISEQDRKMYLDRALMAADWFVNTQLGNDLMQWSADLGRAMYYYYIPDGRYVCGINWSCGRSLFVLTDAYNITKDEKYQEAAKKCGRFIASLQEMDPYFAKAQGAYREELPTCNWAGALDGAQAASGHLMLEKITGDAEWLRRGRAFCDYLLRNFSQESGLVWRATFEPAEEITHYGRNGCISQATAIPFWHLYCRTNEEKYLEPLLFAADVILEHQRDDGPFYFRKDPGDDVKGNHHHGYGEGDDRFILRNDDAMPVVLLAANKATGDAKYLEACVKYADWMTARKPLERPYVSFPAQAIAVLDIGRVAGKDYTPWVLEHLEKNVLQYQVLEHENPKVKGGFLGEDEQGEGGVFGGTSLDYVTTRMTCYSSGVLFRLSGKGTGSGFSVFGLDVPE